MIQLRKYQQDGVDAIRAAFREGKCAPLYQLATGGGKSVIFTYVAKGAAQKGNRIWILAHRQELVHQIEDHLEAQSVPHGVIAAGRAEEPHHHVQVASIQSLVRRLDRLAPPNLIIADEAHHALSQTWSTVLSRFPSAKILGVSATPSLLSGRGLGVQCGGFFDVLIQGPSMDCLISEGFLAKPVYYAPPSSVSTEQLHIVGGDFDRSELSSLMDRPHITGDAVSHYTKLCPNSRALVFCTSIKHAENVAQGFSEAGYTAASIDGKLDDDTRRARVDAFRNGDLRVLVSVNLLEEGFDAPGAEVGIFLRPTASLRVYLQQLGRILRPAHGKSRALILDAVGNCLTHGLAEQPRDWTLDGRVQKRMRTDPAFSNRTCSKCYRVHSWAMTCPECGFVYPVKSRSIRTVDGSLVEITDDDATMLRLKRKQEEGRAHSLPELMAIEKARGYKKGWAWFRWKSRMAHKRSTTPDPAEKTLL